MNDFINKNITSQIHRFGDFIFQKNKTVDKIGGAGIGKKPQSPSSLSSSTRKYEPLVYNQLPKGSRVMLKLAALSGLSAVVMSAYGSHGYFLISLNLKLFYSNTS
jgi:hypothetical protein